MGNKQSKQKKQKKNKQENSKVDDFFLEKWEILDTKYQRRISDTINFDNNDILIPETKTDPLEEYEIIKSLGKGTFGEVFLVKNKIINIKRAMKKIKKDPELDLTDEEIFNEINILKKIEHPNIIKIFEFYITSDAYYLILEYCEGGDLNYFSKLHKLTEKQIAYIMYQILSAINYCHKMKILHRDLKLDNILLKNSENNFCDIKICDFGTAQIFKKNEIQTEIIGTLGYMAPEVINEKYNEKCDLWSCGIMMYNLLTGNNPFIDRNEEKTVENILNKKINKNELSKFNSCTNNLLLKLLEKNPNNRINSEEAINHKLFDFFDIKNKITEIKDKNKIFKYINNLKKFKCNSLLQEITLAYLVHNYPDLQEIKDASKFFAKIDVEKKGKIIKDELYINLSLIINNDELTNDINDIFANIDTNKDNYLSYEEFLRAVVDKEIFLEDNVLKYAFHHFDIQNKGEINLDDLKILFKEHLKNKESMDDLKVMLDEVDANNDGKIDFDEFKEVMYKLLN